MRGDGHGESNSADESGNRLVSTFTSSLRLIQLQYSTEHGAGNGTKLREQFATVQLYGRTTVSRSAELTISGDLVTGKPG